MFLNEVALGKEYEIVQDDSSLIEAPEGYDSVVARGQFEPGKKYSSNPTVMNNLKELFFVTI